MKPSRNALLFIFALLDLSVSYYLLQASLTSLVLLGINFAFYFLLCVFDKRFLSKDIDFRVFGVFLFAAALAVGLRALFFNDAYSLESNFGLLFGVAVVRFIVPRTIQFVMIKYKIR